MKIFNLKMLLLMLARQMAKIEELTLNMLQLQKENPSLKVRITNLENK